MRLLRALAIGSSLMLCQTAFSESAVSKFWNKEFPKNLGCGPGNLIFGEDTWFSTAVASSINLSFSPLLPLSTTSKVSGCNGGPPIVEHRPAYEFFANNLDKIMQDAAQGGGESLQALASYWGVQGQAYQSFTKELQENFADYFANIHSTPLVTYTRIAQLQKQS